MGIIQGKKPEEIVYVTDHALDVNIKSGNVTIGAGDIEIGAVELKDGTTDTRATISSDGLKVDVTKSVLPTGASTSSKQDDLLTSLTNLLTELQKKTDVTEIQTTELIQYLKNLLLVMSNPDFLNKADNSLRTSIVNTIATLTTVTTVSNLGMIDNIQGRTFMMANEFNSWSNTCRARIS